MRVSHLIRSVLTVPAVLLAPAVGSAQITLGQVDTFETGTTLNWSQGINAPADSLQVLAGGPGGASDHYMQIKATGFGAGGRITTFNVNQWLGDYVAAGVNVIEMDLRAPTSNTQSLSIRIAYKETAGLGSPGYVSTTPFSLPNDGLWHHAAFPVTATAMTAVGSPSAFNTVMSAPGEMRILHSAAPALNGDPITAFVGVDNIRASSATPVPEPAGLTAALAAAVAAAVVRRRLVTPRPDPGPSEPRTP